MKAMSLKSKLTGSIIVLGMSAIMLAVTAPAALADDPADAVMSQVLSVTDLVKARQPQLPGGIVKVTPPADGQDIPSGAALLPGATLPTPGGNATLPP